nr:8-oxo-dGTP diphosphatase MutT [uncultured Methylophaga sp.]
MSQIHVAVAVIVQQKEVLIALRKPDQHQGNLWEFPGGKVESGETVQQALTREIKEELAIDILRAEPLIEHSHDYGDKSVLLDVWWIDAFDGTPTGHEGQTIKWVDIEALDHYEFPAANKIIVTAIQQQLNTTQAV